MIDILGYLPAKRKQSTSGWVSFNAVCCTHNGQGQDRRTRGGLKISNDGWSYHCFNCGYTASFILGRNLSFKARKLLTWLGVPQEDIERINLESLKHKSIAGLLSERQQVVNELQGIHFEERTLTDDLTPAWHLDHSRNYLIKRGLQDDYPLFHRTGTRPGIVIPFTYNNQIVGSSIRFLDERTPKYINDIQPGYVFGTDLQQDSWRYVLVMEGVFDALSINGLAVLHADINDAQVRLIRSLGKEVIVVPDHDRAGMSLVDRAVELGWSVSIPNWHEDVKDVNDAVKRYGRLGTLLSIMQAKETSKIKIEMHKRNILRRFE